MNIKHLTNTVKDNFYFDCNGFPIFPGDIVIIKNFYDDLISFGFKQYICMPSIYVVEYFTSLRDTIEVYGHGNNSFGCLYMSDLLLSKQYYLKITLDELNKFDLSYILNRDKNEPLIRYNKDVNLSFISSNLKFIPFSKTSFYRYLMKKRKAVLNRSQWIKKYGSFPFIYYNYGKNIVFHDRYNALPNHGFSLSDYYNQSLEERNFQIYCKPTRNHHYKEYIYHEKKICVN